MNWELLVDVTIVAVLAWLAWTFYASYKKRKWEEQAARERQAWAAAARRAPSQPHEDLGDSAR
jgi:Tfp pilus assembly protein PilE